MSEKNPRDELIFMREDRCVTRVRITHQVADQLEAVLEEVSKEKGIPKSAVLREALRDMEAAVKARKATTPST